MDEINIKEINIKEIKQELAKQIDEKRYEHTIGVADISAALAMKYGEDVEKAYIAGLLHDCAKCLEPKKRNSLIKKYNVPITDFEKENDFLIHAKLGAVLAQEKYGIKDKDIFSAICYHTTGKPEMTVFEKIVFSADYIEPNRKMIRGLQEIRSIIFDDLDEAVYLILLNTIQHLNNKGRAIDQASLDAFHYYKEIHERKYKSND